MFRQPTRQCHGSVLVAGRSFIRHLRDSFGSQHVKVSEHDVEFSGFGGASAASQKQKLSQRHVSNFCIMYVELTTTDETTPKGYI